MADYKVHFVNKEILYIENVERDEIKDNLLYLWTENKAVEYIINLDKVLYIESQE